MLAESRRFAEALVAYDYALSLDPNYVRAWTGKGVALSGLGRHTEAPMTRSTRALAHDPNRADDPQYIARLVCRVVGVSVETVGLTRALAAEVGLAAQQTTTIEPGMISSAGAVLWISTYSGLRASR